LYARNCVGLPDLEQVGVLLQTFMTCCLGMEKSVLLVIFNYRHSCVLGNI